jgi:anthranilate synthase component 2
MHAERAGLCASQPAGVVGVAAACQIPSLVIVVVDNRDSFTWNLVHALEIAGARVRVLDAGSVSTADVLALPARGLVLSPGPGRPEDARVCMELVQVAPAALPLLGVCLGHQVLCHALGARVAHAAEPMHGRTSRLSHTGQSLFAGLPQGFRVARYHSLAVASATLPAELQATAFAEDGTLMAVAHHARPWMSLQFHPESFLTEHGGALVSRFVALTRATAPPQAL